MDMQHSVSAIVAFNTLAAIFIAGCGVSPGAEGSAEEDDADALVASASHALVPVCSATTLTLEAGPIWSSNDANTKCPSVCNPLNMDWNGQWSTTVPGQMSVCGCSPRPAADVEAGPIWNNNDAAIKCPSACASSGSDKRWTGEWSTVIPNEMSVCGCEYEPPTAVNLEAGPIWSNSDANTKCPATCGSARAWNGAWSTTVLGQMSVCGCACTP